MAGGFVKVQSGIIHSTVWRQKPATKVLWITMLTMADREGLVEASIPGLADAAVISLEECLEGLKILGAPDEYSRTKDFDGRRILEVEGGWIILNFRKYREMRSTEEVREQTRLRVQRFREKQACNAGCNGVTQDVTPVTPGNYIAEAEAETEKEECRISEPPKSAPEAAPPLPPLGGGKKKAPKKAQVRTTALKPESVEAFAATWRAVPKTVIRYDQNERRDVEEVVAKGSRLEAERNFQAIVDAGHATPRELYAAFHCYLHQSDNARRGYVQHVSTFYGPKKGTWIEWLEPGKEAIRKQDGEA